MLPVCRVSKNPQQQSTSLVDVERTVDAAGWSSHLLAQTTGSTKKANTQKINTLKGRHKFSRETEKR
jgi:hypothetical protein